MAAEIATGLLGLAAFLGMLVWVFVLVRPGWPAGVSAWLRPGAGIRFPAAPEVHFTLGGEG
jgi:hypothetical protein